MREIRSPTIYDYDLPATYLICVRGKIKAGWSDRLGGMAISLEVRPDGAFETTLLGELRDQAAVLGVLNTLYELHVALLSVSRLSGD